VSRSTKNTLPVAAAKERILGFYSTGPRLREADLDISDLLSSYAESPLLLICEVQVYASGPDKFCMSGHHFLTWTVLQPKEMGLPTTAYYPKEQIREVCVDSNCLVTL